MSGGAPPATSTGCEFCDRGVPLTLAGADGRTEEQRRSLGVMHQMIPTATPWLYADIISHAVLHELRKLRIAVNQGGV